MRFHRTNPALTSFESLESRVMLADFAGPDLTGAINDQVMPVVLAPGEYGTIRANISNIGDEAAIAGSFKVKVVFSTDTIADAGDVFLGDWTGRINLAAGKSATISISVQLPPGMAPGQYKTLLVIDAEENVAESNEIDNNVIVAKNSGGTDRVRDVVWKFGTFEGRTKVQLILRGPGAGDEGGATFFKLTGPGYGEVTPNPGGDGYIVTLRTTDLRSVATFTATAAADSKIQSLIVENGSIKTISAPNVDLVGDLWVDGACSGISLANVGVADAADVSITVGSSLLAPKTTLSLLMKEVNNLQLDSDIAIKSLTAVNWADSANGNGAPVDGDELDVITAPSIATLKVTGVGAANGDMLAGLDVTGSPLAVDLGTVVIAGGVANSLWEVVGAAKSITIKGRVTDSTFRIDGNVKAMSVGAFVDSDLLVGVSGAAIGHATAAGDFTAASTLASFKVLGIAGADASERFFANSNISATKVGTVSLLNVEIDNGGTPFGLFLKNIANARGEVKSVSAKDTYSGFSWLWKPANENNLTLQDFTVSLLDELVID